MEVKKQYKGVKVYSKLAGMLVEVNSKNYKLLDKKYYVTPTKKSSDKSSTDTKGEDDSN